MTRGPNSTYRSVQMSNEEAEILDEAVAEAKKADPLMTRNKFIRRWIAGLRKT